MQTARFIPAIVLLLSFDSAAHAEAFGRISLERLRATHERVKALANERVPVDLKCGYEDYRALLHIHSSLSHDSRGTLEEIIAAAKACGVRAILFTEHPGDQFDYFSDGHQGMVDDVLLIPGAETRGFLASPRRSLKAESPDTPQAFADLVRRDDGLVFLSHLEERMDWDIDGLTGSEIYNLHADFKDEVRFGIETLLLMLTLAPALQQYPQETFAAMQDYPADYLKKFDAMCQKARHTGVAGNDSHHGQGLRGTLTAEGKVEFITALGRKFAEFDPAKMPALIPLVEGKKTGDLVLEVDLDPYERTFRHCSTHLFMHELSQESVWDALQEGRAYVAFDWIADPSGFVFLAEKKERTWPIGSEVPFGEDLRLRATAPLAGSFRLWRDGKLIDRQESATFDKSIDAPGVYRVEVWLTLAGEPRPWILSNPIYVRGAK